MFFKLLSEFKQLKEREKIKKYLERTLTLDMIKNEKRIDVNEDEFIIDGKVYPSKVVIQEMTKWAAENFVFMNNDVLLPHPAPPIMNSYDLVKKHNDLTVGIFSDKYANISLSYLLYNAFLLGYEAGIEYQLNNTKEVIKQTVSDYIKDNHGEETTSKPIDPEKFVNNVSTPIEIDTSQYEAFKKKQAEMKDSKLEFQATVKKKDMAGSFQDKDNEVEVFSEGIYDENNHLIIDSKRYKLGSYEKFISTVVEDKLKEHGMTIDNIYTDNFPTYIIAEAALKVKDQDVINEDQVRVRDQFYSYLDDFRKSLTKKNTTV